MNVVLLCVAVSFCGGRVFGRAMCGPHSVGELTTSPSLSLYMMVVLPAFGGPTIRITQGGVEEKSRVTAERAAPIL